MKKREEKDQQKYKQIIHLSNSYLRHAVLVIMYITGLISDEGISVSQQTQKSIKELLYYPTLILI